MVKITNRMFTKFVCVALLLVALLHCHAPRAYAEDDAAVPTATAARLGGDINRTRFVVDLSGPLGFSVYVLAEPYRIIIDLPEINFQFPAGLGTVGQGLISAYRYGLFEAGKSRIVLDAVDPVLIENSFVLRPENGQPARLVVDLIRTDEETFARIQGLIAEEDEEEAEEQQAEAVVEETPVDEPDIVADAPIPSPNPLRSGELTLAQIEAEREALRLEQAGPVRRTIVLDPGHGGVDPGAVGRGGTPEKRVVLAFASVMRELLEETGRYDVFMTRDDDTFVRLRSRVSYARDHNADLFVAIHADSHRRSSTRGATVYTLSERASDREAAELASRENKSDLIAGLDLAEENDDVMGILLDLAQRETNNLSVHLAREIVDSLDGVTELTGRPHRTAAFVVLKAPDVPSVLLELGFISNREDEALLQTTEWRQKVGTSLLAAIDAFFAE